jgi:PKD repeat protein
MLSLTFTLFLNTVKGQDWQLLDGKNTSIETKINLVSTKSQQMVLEFDFSAYALKEVNTSKGLVNYINVPNCSRTKIKGAPDLPKISQAMALNKMAGLELNIVESEYIEIDNIDLAPSKGILTRDKDPNSIPFEFGNVYSQNEFYPSNIAEMSESYYIRNTAGQNVMVYPVQYNPVTKKVRVYSKIVVEFVEKAGVKRALNFNPNAQNDDVFENVLSNHFINYTTPSTKYTPVSEGNKNMLIVCYSSFTDEMAEFVSWKESIGYTVNMVDYSTIGSSSALKTYVQNQYDNNGISYLLLVGDHGQVPSYNASAGYSDNYYGYTSGSDHYLDIFVGRFSADNTTDLQTQIDRTIYYESQVSSSDSWFKNGVGIASNEGGSGGDDGEDDETHMDNIQTDLEGFGYSMDAVYQDGGSASQLSSIINNGCGIINYVGHGSNTTWASMVYTQSNVNALTNENELPFVISVACVVGNFTSQTCFAETWLRATNNGNPTGGIVFCGSTINQSWASPMCAQDEMNDLLVAGSYINYGGMFVNGMFQMIDEYGSDGENMADTWTVFGDPSLQMRTPGQPDGPAGSEPTAPTANFGASTTTVLAGNTVSFTDNSSQSPTSWSWTFEGGTPSTSTSENPTVTYNTVGTYDVTLTATNTIGSDSETKYNYIEVVDELPVEYCESKGTDYSYEWIAGVSIGDFSNTSTGASYTDFTSQTVEMEIGAEYNVTLTPGFASSTYNEYWKIWIDYNNDKTFSTDELAFDAGSLSKNAVSGTMNIPSSASGTTRMRVSMKYNAEQTACETFTYGEVEDIHCNFW